MSDYLEELKKVELSTNQRVQAIFNGSHAIQTLVALNVLPVLVTTLNRTPWEEAIAATYYRMSGWMKSLVVLNSPIHFQATCAAARSMFELLLDMKELAKDPKKAEAYHDFTFVRRFRNAELKINHHDHSHGKDETVYVHERTFVTDPANVTRCATLRLKHWTDKTGSPIWPDHWSKGDAFTRATNAGQKYADIYREDYGRLSWNIHAGAVGIGGLSQDGIRNCYGWSHALSQDFMFEATDDIANAFHLYSGNPNLKGQIEKARSIPGRSLVQMMMEAKETAAI